MTEVLIANGKEYRLLESTLPKENFLEAEALLKTIPYFAKETNDPEIIRHALNGLLNAKAFKYYADRYMKDIFLVYF